MRNPDPALDPAIVAGVTETLLAGTDRLVHQQAITAREPDGDVAAQDLAWWLGLQERLEIRAELSHAGLL